ncbi:hypothetical protein Hypma_005667 [Hypsizygus marmoreus]|uniref:BTB domain-containing protein n=1 Tax=Hypsizygus marmoreus TaxID=39966 RepID=A0A369JYV1_HYPMA|nr:hypothetical protein Hypma_005667 [Hypsizygus marmoreus]
MRRNSYEKIAIFMVVAAWRSGPPLVDEFVDDNSRSHEQTSFTTGLFLRLYHTISSFTLYLPGMSPTLQPPAASSEAPASRHSEFWLYDGSIVLAVQGTLFRVHQTILANHSEVFSDLFSLPQPKKDDNDEEERIEGCQVVYLPDNAEDFVDLLRAIYHPSHFDKLSPNADLDTILTFISGILRLSTKYYIRELRKRCLAILTARFPTTYQDYMTKCPPPRAYELAASNSTAASNVAALANLITFTLAASPLLSAAASAPPTPPGPNNSASPPTANAPFHVHPPLPSQQPQLQQPQSSHSSQSQSHSHSPSHRDRERDKSKSKGKESPPPKPKASSIMRAISLAQETNVPLILPYASYLLARTSAPRRFLSHSPSSHLSWHQKTICLVGRALLRNAELSLTHSFLIAFQVSPRCLSPDQCSNSRGPLLEWAMLESAGRGPEPLRPWDRWERLGVCNECVADAKRKHERGREEVWERLPDFFDLGPWKELRATQGR